MQNTLDEALAALFGSAQETPLAGAPQVTGVPQSNTAIDQERLQLAAAQQAIDSLRALLSAAPAGKH